MFFIKKYKISNRYVIWLAFATFIVSFWFVYFQNILNTNSSEAIASDSWSDIKKWEYIAVLSQKLLESKPSSRRSMISSYCNTVFSDDLADWFQHSSFHYSPAKSIFLHSICHPLEDSEWFDFDESEFDDNLLDYINDWYQQQLIDPQTWCDYTTDMNDCKFSYMLPTIFGTIMNEYSNIKLASIYWLSNTDIEESIEEFSNTFFGKPEDIWCDWKTYLHAQDVEDNNKRHCQHPHTYVYLAWYLQEIQQLLQNAIVLNWNEILDQDISSDQCVMNSDTDIIACSIKNNDYHWENFKNLLLNETMFYNLFITYFISNSNNMELTWFSATSSANTVLREMSAEVEALQKEVHRSQEAVDLSWDSLINTYSTFPVHIWLMAYREDVINFRDNFAKVYTPVQQMYYRFRNVQDTRR